MNLLTVNGVSHSYPASGGRQAVLRQLDLSLKEGETMALLGRSGCGKSTLARLLAGLESPREGAVTWRGQALNRLNRPQRRQFNREVQMVFQDGPGAVNPRHTLGQIIEEPLRHLSTMTRGQRQQRVHEMMEAVALDPALLGQLPAQISGGQLQRVCIARALAPAPRLLILDEAVSSLDLVLQADIIRLLKQLRQQFDIAFLFITHDLRLVERFCQRVVVMSDGHIVEDVPVQPGLTFCSAAGQALQQAVLPAFPRPRSQTRKGALCSV
ncbi:nickel import ATP-binding protein NikE [Shimwellia blattae]|uniref:Nickel import ATP-binding protein NikE n=1 Tax=Shimwellia blattae (strain ATCC 29907 / DSM 4481 / JCM 1650 / NBRC 105725 / CDC 9005-74) TaxID=630626 RepID=I2B8T4_SHIBC|nr:nickel import ATP-binding protein NikE [Shimwellia blattae]AFJ46938.1 nickel transport ATP-binding protein NikE [Shimwellia blattae DSM 4481 = NBRC 105725]GAB82401.1 nickel ABC transporter ATP-binding protein NikE [Shimwellia blattae DSM 4481 = NBRC 105725]VDY64431.1 Glutathione import ATP-binding protein GsiA [Shimwellia blattae]VEC22540.1 Glutathione import ATP-binding protein GsiA [Shimwellia blattae]